jgi:hypothetical protein
VLAISRAAAEAVAVSPAAAAAEEIVPAASGWGGGRLASRG